MSLAETITQERQRLQDVLSLLPGYVVLLSSDYHIVFANRYFAERFGEPGGKLCYEHLFQGRQPCDPCPAAAALQERRPQHREWTGPDGRTYEADDFPFTEPDGTQLVMEVGIDVTERKAAEERLRQLNRALRAIRDCSQLVLHSQDEQALLDGVCRVLVEQCGYALAWVGFPQDDEAKSVRPVAIAGAGQDYVTPAMVTWADERRGWGPTGSAIRTGQITVIDDAASDPRFAPWREQALQHGFHACAGFPLDIGESLPAALSILAPTESFQGEELRLLSDLVQDLGFGIRALRMRADRERAVKALQVSESRYRSLVLATSQLVWSTDPQGQVEDIPGWRALTGQTVEEVKGWGWSEALHPEDRERTKAIWAEAIQHRSAYETEYRVRRQDGEYCYLAARGAPVFDEDGGIREWVGTCNDISARKRAEEEVRRSMRYTRTLIEASLDPLVTINREGKITDVNAATEKATGIPREQLIGADFSNYFTEPEFARAGYQRVFAEGSVRDYPLAIRDRAGRVREVLYNATVFKNEAGGVEGVFAAARDVTERNRAQAARARAEAELRRLNEELERRVTERTAALEAANLDLEAFAYSVSHDLRAPLRQIDGFSKILIEEYEGALDANGQKYLHWVRHGTQSMGRLVDDLLSLSRIGRQAINPVFTSLRSLVEEVREDLAGETAGRSIEWKLGELPFLECDPGLMKQVVANLLSNAIKFTRPRARAVIEVGQQQVDGCAAVFVRDNGVGFDMKYADKLFGVFQRLHRQQDFEGTGIGLATVQRIIHKHGGRVWADAVLDQGATFYFTLDSVRETTREPSVEVLACPTK